MVVFMSVALLFGLSVSRSHALGCLKVQQTTLFAPGQANAVREKLLRAAADGVIGTELVLACSAGRTPRSDGAEDSREGNDQAASSYSWMSPPMRSRRWTVPALLAARGGRGGVRSRPRCGRPRCSARRTRQGSSRGDVRRTRFRERTGVRIVSAPMEAKTWSKVAVNLVSRSRTRNRTAVRRLRARHRSCGDLGDQEPLGLAVTPRRCTTRRSISITKPRSSGGGGWCRR